MTDSANAPGADTDDWVDAIVAVAYIGIKILSLFASEAGGGQAYELGDVQFYEDRGEIYAKNVGKNPINLVFSGSDGSDEATILPLRINYDATPVSKTLEQYSNGIVAVSPERILQRPTPEIGENGYVKALSLAIAAVSVGVLISTTEFQVRWSRDMYGNSMFEAFAAKKAITSFSGRATIKNTVTGDSATVEFDSKSNQIDSPGSEPFARAYAPAGLDFGSIADLNVSVEAVYAAGEPGDFPESR